MKKVIVIFSVLILSLGLCACEKTADPINLPKTSEITSIEISDTNDDLLLSITETADIEKIIADVMGATATTKSSVQDMPDVDNYYKADITCDEKITTLFFYEENENFYVEQPYQGIYEMKTSLQKWIGNVK